MPRPRDCPQRAASAADPADYVAYDHASRAHLAPAKDPRAIEPPDRGEIIAIPEVGGLHHQYSRGAA
jgi:hypothetical protein